SVVEDKLNLLHILTVVQGEHNSHHVPLIGFLKKERTAQRVGGGHHAALSVGIQDLLQKIVLASRDGSCRIVAAIEVSGHCKVQVATVRLSRVHLNDFLHMVAHRQ